VSARGRALLAVGVALLQAVVLACLVGGLVGAAALASPAVWVAILGASLALAVEAASQERDDAVGQLPLETITGLLLLSLVVMAALGATNADHAVVAGAAIGLGVVLRAAALRSLGRGFGTRPQPGDDLVERGLYAWLRHPSELGLISLAGGFALLGASPAAGLLWLLLVAVAQVRVRCEERDLERRFGDRYRRYRSRSWLNRGSAKG